MPPEIPTDISEQVRECATRMSEEGVHALASLFDLTSDRLVRLAVTVTRNQHDAEDAVQTVLLRVSSQPANFAKTDHPWHYLLRTVRNEALGMLRIRKRFIDSYDLSDLNIQLPVRLFEQGEMIQAVWRALRKIPVNQSEVVVLKIWEGLTFQQIGSILNINEATAASRYRYAMEKLSSSLAAHKPESQSASMPQPKGGRP